MKQSARNSIKKGRMKWEYMIVEILALEGKVCIYVETRFTEAISNTGQFHDI